MAFGSIEQLKRNGTNCRLLKSLQVVHQCSVKTLFISTLTFPENAGAQIIQQSGMPLCDRVPFFLFKVPADLNLVSLTHNSLHLIKGVPVISGNKAWKMFYIRKLPFLTRKQCLFNSALGKHGKSFQLSSPQENVFRQGSNMDCVGFQLL